mmetsp:Transcript_35303/g.94570  ORF Transcript_35303/g.94570 Transcript_35303/m.94570 type:complete len:235 (+) Transcript_35303:1655-2359(+)
MKSSFEKFITPIRSRKVCELRSHHSCGETSFFSADCCTFCPCSSVPVRKYTSRPSGNQECARARAWVCMGWRRSRGERRCSPSVLMDIRRTQPHPAGDDVARESGVGVANVRLVVDIVDRGRYIEGRLVRLRRRSARTHRRRRHRAATAGMHAGFADGRKARVGQPSPPSPVTSAKAAVATAAVPDVAAADRADAEQLRACVAVQGRWRRGAQVRSGPGSRTTRHGGGEGHGVA